MDLRPYQRRTLRDVSALYAQGAKSVLIASPTGSGKSLMCSVAARNHLAASPERRAVVSVHRYELVDQWLRTLRTIGVEAGPLGSSARCTVAMVQSLVARKEAPRATFVILDEARHYCAAEWLEVRRAYADVMVLGADATPERQDGLGLGLIFDHLVVAAQIKELIAARVLVPCRVISARDMLDSRHIAQDPVAAFRKHTPHGQAVVFARNVPTSKDYQSAFVKAGVVAMHIDGKTDPDQRRAALAGFAEQSVRVVTNVQVLTEGWDSPGADTCILARGCASQGAFLQMVGRVLRAAPGKTGATLLDLAGVVNVLGPPDEDRVYSLEGRAIKRTACEEQICRQCGRLASACECGAAQDLGPPVVTGEDLVDWHERYRAAKDELQPSRTALALASILRRAADAYRRGKPWKQGAVEHRYRAIFKRPPDAATTAMANRVNALSDPEYAALLARSKETKRAS